MVNLLLSKIFQSERINFAIFILYSIFTGTFFLFSGTFIYPNLETLLLVVIASSFFTSIDVYLAGTHSHDPRLINGNNFPSYGYFFSIKYWSRIESEFFWVVLPICLPISIVLLWIALSPQWYKINSLYSNEFIFLVCLLGSLFFHIFFFILTRKRVKKFLNIDV